MKLNTPITEEERKQADEDYKSRAERWKKALLEIADLMEANKPLTDFQRDAAAGAVRSLARDMKTERPKPVGASQKLPDDIAITFHSARAGGKKYEALLAEYAERYGVTVKAVEKAVKEKSEDPTAAYLISLLKLPEN